MKRLLSLSAVLLLLFSLAACLPNSKVIDGYVYYEGAKNNKRFQYPESWFLLDSSVLDDPESQSIFSDLGMSIANLEASFESLGFTAILYNLDHGDPDSFFANLAFSELDAGDGFSTEKLTDPQYLPTLKGQVENQLAVSFDNVEWVEEPRAKTYGDVDTLSYRIDYDDYLGNAARLYSVQFIQEDIHYVFAYMVPVEFAFAAGEEIDEEIENIIGSFEGKV